MVPAVWLAREPVSLYVVFGVRPVRIWNRVLPLRDEFVSAAALPLAAVLVSEKSPLRQGTVWPDSKLPLIA